METYAAAIIDKLEQSINDRDKEFTGVPLQTRLLAEAFNQSDVSECNLTDKLDLLGFYKRFTVRKYDIYQDEKIEPYTDTFETSRLKYVVTGPETSLAILLETLSEPRPAQGRRPTAANVAMVRVGGGVGVASFSSWSH